MSDKSFARSKGASTVVMSPYIAFAVGRSSATRAVCVRIADPGAGRVAQLFPHR